MSHVGHGRQANSGAAPDPGGKGPLYSPADPRGNFALLAEDSAFDLEELEHDVSERKPGGPVAESILALPPPILALKWAIPFVGFLVASLFQSIGVFSSTCAYAGWMTTLESQFNHSNPSLNHFALPDIYVGRELPGRRLQPRTSYPHWALHGGHVARDRPVGSSSVDSSSSSFLPVSSSMNSMDSSFRSSSFGSSSASSSGSSLDLGWLLPPLQNVITGSLAIAWFIVVLKTKNLRLWTQTMLVGIVLALLKGLFTLTTVLPDPSGWDQCKAGLDSNILSAAREHSAPGMLGLVDIFNIWIVAPRSLVCSDGILSRSTYVASLYALGLYDAGRKETRKLKPHFRWLCRLLYGTVLTILVVWSGRADVESRHQYTLDVALALVFTLLVYGSPVVALGVDKWLTLSSGHLSLSVGGDKDSYDEGDLVVPICCFPCCCLHGRFFLYSATARDAESEIKTREEQEKATTNDFRKMAASKAEEFRVTQEDAARRLLELEALIDAEQQRSEARERDDEQEARQLLDAAIAETREQFKERTASTLKDLENQVLERKQAADKLQNQVSEEPAESNEVSETEAKLAEEMKQAQDKAEVDLLEKKQELSQLEEVLARYREDAKELGIPDS